MAWSATPLGFVASTTAASSYATGSYTPTANRLLVAFVQNSGPGADDTADDHPTFAGNGVTWFEVAQAIPDASPRVLTMFVALSGTSPTTGAATASYGQNQAGACISVEEVEVDGGVPATALGAITQSVAFASTAGATAPTQALGSAPAATSRCMAGWSINRNEAMGVRTNWTEFHDIGFATPDTHLETQWRSDTAEQTAGTSWATSSLYRVIVAEIAQTSAGTDATVTPATIAATVAMPAVTVSAGATVTPATIAATTALPSAAPTAGSTVTPAVIAAVADLPVVTVVTGGNATVTPEVIEAVAALPAVTVLAGSTVSPATIETAVSLAQATASASSTVSPDTIAVTVNLPGVTVVVPLVFLRAEAGISSTLGGEASISASSAEPSLSSSERSEGRIS